MAQQTLIVNMQVVIASALSLVTTSLPSGVVGQAYSVQLQAAGGVAPYTWSATGLPAGLTMSPGGLLSGVPTAAGSFSPVVTVVDSGTAN